MAARPRHGRARMIAIAAISPGELSDMVNLSRPKTPLAL
jgi:hypothetical protein